MTGAPHNPTAVVSYLKEHGEIKTTLSELVNEAVKQRAANPLKLIRDMLSTRLQETPPHSAAVAASVNAAADHRSAVDHLRSPSRTTESIFHLLDTDGSGFLTLDELEEALKTTSGDMNAQELKKLVEEIDRNKDGKIDYEEFASMMRDELPGLKQLRSRVHV